MKSSEIEKLFKKVFSKTPEVISKVPGRLEILGNHTDYNEGLVISTAVDRCTQIAMKKTDGYICRVYSDQVDNSTRSFELDSNISKNCDWLNYIRGVTAEFFKRDLPIGAFEAVIISDIPLSAGMSSSASLEMALVCGLCELFDIPLENNQKALIGRDCENNCIGAETGLLDQMSSLHGRSDFFTLIDFRNFEISYIPIPADTVWLVVNTGVKHDLTEDYNSRRKDCEKACEILHRESGSIKSLRDISTEKLRYYTSLLPDKAFKRALHICGENDRVKQAEKLLNAGKSEEFGQLLFESHLSSINNFENSCPELDFLVDFAADSDLCLGARLSGGGFGGVTIHLLKAEYLEIYAKLLKSAYENRFGFEPDLFVCKSSDGAKAYKT